jgi:putative iron-only hydrogenase system regulator
MDNRIAIVGVVIEEKESVEKVNDVLHRFAERIVGRMGLPFREKGVAVISLIVDGTNDQISAMTGALGRVQGISVKSMITKSVDKKSREGEM